MSETWRVIPAWSNYEVSDAGRVRNIGTGRVLKPWLRKAGYYQVTLFRDGERKQINVCRLVLMAFVGMPADGYEAAHWDGDRTNDCPGNLRWATRSENYQDRHRHGTQNDGERNGRALLTVEQVRAIRADNRGKTKLSREYGVSPAQIQRIRSGKQWVGA